MGYAKYYEDNIKLSEERERERDISYIFKSNHSKTKKTKQELCCPFCNQVNFDSKSTLEQHILSNHANAVVFFEVNNTKLTTDASFSSITTISVKNLSSFKVTAKIYLPNQREIASSTLIFPKKTVDFTQIINKYVFDSLILQLQAPFISKSFIIKQDPKIEHIYENGILKKNTYADLFVSQVAKGIYSLHQYELYLDLLIQENRTLDAEMLLLHIRNHDDNLRALQDDIINFSIKYALFTGQPEYDLLSQTKSIKNEIAFNIFINALKYNTSNEESISLGKPENDFHFSCLLLHSFVVGNSADIDYYQTQYRGNGFISNILEMLIGIKSLPKEDYVSQFQKNYSLLKNLRYYKLIDDICSIYESASESKILPLETYNNFNRISPLVCALRIEEETNSDIKKRIIKSSVKRFNNCNWFINFISSNSEEKPIEKKISLKINPSQYWEYIRNLSSNLKTPFTDSYLNYLKDTCEVELYRIGDSFSGGRSCYVLTVSGYNILLDCGINVAATEPNIYPDFSKCTKDIDIIVLSHAHADHSGALAKAHSIWPNAIIISSFATKDLMEPILHDMTKQNIAKEEFNLQDTISIEQARNTYESITTLNYETWFVFGENAKIMLHEAGHIMGASIIELQIDNKTILYTGDFSLHGQRLCNGLNIWNLPTKVDLLISEATYIHQPQIKDWISQRIYLEEELEKAISEKNTVLFPANAFGRAQELFGIIADMINENRLAKDTKIYMSEFALKTCISASKNVFKGYLDLLNSNNCLTSDKLQGIEKGAIIIATPPSVRYGTVSYNVVCTFNRSMPTHFKIFYSGFLNNQTRKGLNSNVKLIHSPLNTHASKQDVINLIKMIIPKNLVLTHWGSNDFFERKSIIEEIQNIFPGEMRVVDFSNEQLISLKDIKNWLEKEIKNGE